MRYFNKADRDDMKTLVKGKDSFEKAEHNVEGRKIVEDHAKHMVNQMQRMLKEHGDLLSSKGDEHHSPGHLSRVAEQIRGLHVPYTHDHIKIHSGPDKNDMVGYTKEKKTFKHFIGNK